MITSHVAKIAWSASLSPSPSVPTSPAIVVIRRAVISSKVSVAAGCVQLLAEAVEGVVLEQLLLDAGGRRGALPVAHEQDQLAVGDAAEEPLHERGAHETGRAGDGDALASERVSDHNASCLPDGRQVRQRGPMSSAELPTRERILDAAIDLFGTRGVDAVSLDEIARDVGVRKQTVLYWFASKDELVDAVLEQVASELLVVIDAAIRSRPTIRSSGSTPWCEPCSGRPCGARRCSDWCARSAASRPRRPIACASRCSRWSSAPPLPAPRDGQGTAAPADPGLIAALGVRHRHRHRHRARGAAARGLAADRRRPPPPPRRAEGLPPRRPGSPATWSGDSGAGMTPTLASFTYLSS
jgi:AcrR family transcriptional regulator